MDYGRSGQNNQNHNDQWDRWNSNASNSSYYNQPVHKPYGQNFSIASMVCGIMSMTTCCAILFSLPLGALGLLFAHLASRRGKRMNSSCLMGVVCSCVGLVSAGVMILYSFAMLPSMMQNENFKSQFDAVTQQMYGMDFEEFMEEFYGYSIEGSASPEE